MSTAVRHALELTGDAPPSLTAFRERHSLLMRALREREAGGGAAGPAFPMDDVVALIEYGRAVGRTLDEDGPRADAQSLLDYWGALLFRESQLDVDATLAEYDPACAPTLSDADCPYVGLKAFQETDAQYFFGRGALLADLMAYLEARRFVAVVGPSGSGKSSLVLAGVLPRIRNGLADELLPRDVLPVVVPGSDPVRSLARAARASGLAADGVDDLALERQIREPDGFVRLLAARGRPVVLVVDQLEELFTLCDDAGQLAAFARTLVECATSELPHRVLVTMRSEFDNRVARLPELLPLFERGRVTVRPLSRDELSDAIVRPAEAVGLRFEGAVVERLVDEVLGTPAGPPLLQFALVQLWRLRERDRVTSAGYAKLGSALAALARTADSVFLRLPVEEQTTARRVLLRMVRLNDGLEVYSSRVRLADLEQMGDVPERIRQVLSALQAANLVRQSSSTAREDVQYELAHEALVRNWPRFVDWVAEEREHLVMRRRLEFLASEWTSLGGSTGGLLDEDQLADAERWFGSAHAVSLGCSPGVRSLIDASRAAADQRRLLADEARDREAKQAAEAKWVDHVLRTNRRLRNLTILTVASLAAAVASYLREVRVRHEQAADALSEARRAESTDPVRALRLAVFAAKQHNNAGPDTLIRDVLRQYLLPVAELPTSAYMIRAAVFDPRGTHVAAAGDDGRVRVWRLAPDGMRWLPEPNRRATPAASGARRDSTLYTVAYSPDGELLAAAGTDGNVYVGPARGGELSALPGRSEGSVFAVAFSPDGGRLATAGGDGRIRVRERSADGSWRLLSALADARVSDTYLSLRFDRTGGRLMATASDGMARIWDTRTWRLTTVLDPQSQEMWDADFAPNDTLVVTGSRSGTGGRDGAVRVWNVGRGVGPRPEPITAYTVPMSEMRSVRFSPTEDGVIVASGPDGSALRLRLSSCAASAVDGSTRTACALDVHGVAAGPRLRVRGVAFSSDGRHLVTPTENGVVRVWRSRPNPCPTCRTRDTRLQFVLDSVLPRVGP